MDGTMPPGGGKGWRPQGVRRQPRARRGRQEPVLQLFLAFSLAVLLSIAPSPGRAQQKRALPAGAHEAGARPHPPPLRRRRLPAKQGSDLDRIAIAVDGAESSWGADPRMWRPDPLGPQGPMQVSAAAAADVGGGDRFDSRENFALGRAYLGLMYRRFGSWADAVAAYNWGPGRLDAWIKSGRLWTRLPLSVALYRARVLYGSTLPAGAWALVVRGIFPMRRLGIVHAQPRRRRVPALSAASRRQIASLYEAVMEASASGALDLR